MIRVSHWLQDGAHSNTVYFRLHILCYLLFLCCRRKHVVADVIVVGDDYDLGDALIMLEKLLFLEITCCRRLYCCRRNLVCTEAGEPYIPPFVYKILSFQL